MTITIRTEEETLAEVPGRPDHCRVPPEDKLAGDIDGVKKLLGQITFAPSCVDMGWGWQVEKIYVEPDAAGDAVLAGYRLRTTFCRPDRTTGVVAVGFGRWWEVPLDVTVSGVIKTAFAAAKMILEHELMESFKWRNARIFDPHNTVSELAGITGARWIDSIP